MKDQTCNQTCNQFATEYITKQAAIDALRVAYWDDDIQSAKDDPCIVDAMTDWAIRQVKALPPAQPESLVNESRPLVKDTISRQAAIDAINCDITITGRQNAELVAATIGAFVDRIKALPSAQPEIIRCKDCKHYKYGICKKAGLCVNKSPNGFCDWGEVTE